MDGASERLGFLFPKPEVQRSGWHFCPWYVDSPWLSPAIARTETTFHDAVIGTPQGASTEPSTSQIGASIAASMRAPAEREPFPAPFEEYDAIAGLLVGQEAVGQLSPEVRSLLQAVSTSIARDAWHVSGWNIFEVLGRVWLEDAHSDAIAWLLKPWESHGLGARFLRDFFRVGTRKKLPNNRVHYVTPRKPIGPDARRVDIEVQGDGWILAIENKIRHSDVSGQIKDYAEYYSRLGRPGVEVFGVYLTWMGESPVTNEVFNPMTYRQLRVILERNLGYATTDGKQFVRWFADHLLKDMEG